MKYGIISVLLILALSFVACDSELLPTALAATTQDTVSEVKADSADVFDQIQGNIDLVAELKAKVQDAQLKGKPLSLNSVIKDVETVTKSYEKLASQKDDIRKALLQKIANLEKMRTTIDAETKILNQRKADYLGQLRTLNEPNPEIARARQKALSKAIDYVDIQVALWVQFNSIERDIVIEMTDIQQTIDSFLAMIESTAIVFREGLNLLYLQQDINEAVALFASDIPRMEQLTQDMERSWDNLDYLLESLTGIANIRTRAY